MLEKYLLKDNEKYRFDQNISFADPFPQHI